MSIVLRPASNPRRSLILVVMATSVAAALLGGCTMTSPFASDTADFSSSGTKLADDASPEAVAAATAQWAAAYAKKPTDPKLALGYGRALKAGGNKDQALQVLQAAYQANVADGQLAAELGRLALDMGRMDIAKYTLHVAEAQGVNDWKTLSAQGTLHAKQGEHAQAQQYYLAALQAQPDAISVTNNLALSYALDGKADKAEDLLRKTVASGHGDKRVRQNLALVLGVQGKFGEARKMASLDMPEADAKSSMAYLRNMLDSSTNVASLGPDDGGASGRGADWQPYAENSPANGAEPVRSAALTAGAIPARTVETPLRAFQVAAAPKGDKIATVPPAGGTTTVTKTTSEETAAPAESQTVAQAVVAPKGDKLASTTPARTAALLKADTE